MGHGQYVGMLRGKVNPAGLALAPKLRNTRHGSGLGADMTIEWWIVLATLGGPVLAVQTQKFIERAGENRRQKLAIFATLMANRATRLNDDYIRALNSFELRFLTR